MFESRLLVNFILGLEIVKFWKKRKGRVSNILLQMPIILVDFYFGKCTYSHFSFF